MTTFKPRHLPEPAHETEHPEPDCAAARNPVPPGQALDILLVDDEPDMRFLMTRMLLRAGAARVRTCAGGQEALDSLDAADLPYLVVLDQNMPGMTGAQALERLRERTWTCRC